VKAALLDIDGTLVDTNYLHVEAWARAFEELGRPFPRASIHHQIGKGADQFLPVFLDDAELRERADRRHSELYAELRPHGYPLPGASELLVRLSELGIASWIATSAKPDEIDELLQRLGAADKVAGVWQTLD
jgi:phosphoglycolate phosphatase-like HAD superfamily hydrolase